RRHALLYVAARDQNAPAARAEPLRAMLDGARKEGDFPLVAAVIEPLLLEIPPAKDLASLAGDAVRALVATGHPAEASQWLAVADPETVRLLYPLSRLALGESGPAADAKLAGETADALTRSEGEAGPRRAALALALLSAFGDPVGPSQWLPLVAAQPVVSLDLPGAPVWFDLPRAAASRRLGETVLLAAIAAGEGERLSMQPARLVPAIEALRAVGLESEARRIAVEAALAGGL
ncbi:MAG: hypothetical protein JO010_07680, partial [Alphaproteobacteria bacterium]|nr:hypothetical protein [Alphaproteobacteria bacterium]